MGGGGWAGGGGGEGFDPIAHRKAKIVCNIGLSECNKAKDNSEIIFLIS